MAGTVPSFSSFGFTHTEALPQKRILWSLKDNSISEGLRQASCPRLLKFQFSWKVFSALVICLIVEYFLKTPGGLFCFQSPPIVWEQSTPNTETLSFKTLLCIFPTVCSIPLSCVKHIIYVQTPQSEPCSWSRLLLKRLLENKMRGKNPQGKKEELHRTCLKTVDWKLLASPFPTVPIFGTFL